MDILGGREGVRVVRWHEKGAMARLGQEWQRRWGGLQKKRVGLSSASGGPESRNGERRC